MIFRNDEPARRGQPATVPGYQQLTRELGRTLTTHVGSFVRPEALRHHLLDRAADGSSHVPLGAPIGSVATDFVRAIVRRQSLTGLDLVNDGEQSKIGYADYAMERLSGFEPRKRTHGGITMLEQRDFPNLYASRSSAALPAAYACVGPVGYQGHEALRSDIENLLGSTAGHGVQGLFMTAASPGLASRHANEYYATDEEYRATVAEALRVEYETIVAAGVVLQIDCPDIGTFLRTRALEPADVRRYAAQSIELLDFATRNIDPAMMRMHVCCGADEAPHTRDIEIRWIVDLLLDARPSGLMVVGANGRHEHEWRDWLSVELPEDKVLIPGVIDSTSNIVEHPRTVADRIVRYAAIVGRDRVVGSADCGFSASVRANVPLVDPEIAWAKLRVLVEGAQLASRILW